MKCFFFLYACNLVVVDTKRGTDGENVLAQEHLLRKIIRIHVPETPRAHLDALTTVLTHHALDNNLVPTPPLQYQSRLHLIRDIPGELQQEEG